MVVEVHVLVVAMGAATAVSFPVREAAKIHVPVLALAVVPVALEPVLLDVPTVAIQDVMVNAMAVHHVVVVVVAAVVHVVQVVVRVLSHVALNADMVVQAHVEAAHVGLDALDPVRIHAELGARQSQRL